MLQTCYSLGNNFLAAGCNNDLGVILSLVSAPLCFDLTVYLI